MRNFTKDDGIRSDDMVHSAMDHLTAARVLFSGDPGHYDAGGYLAHMGVELILKGWLFEVSGKFPGTHNLTDLYGILAKDHGAPTLSVDEFSTLKALDQFEALRYPNRSTPTEVGTEQWEKAEVLIGKFCREMPASIQGALGRIEPGHKGGRVLMRKKRQ